MGTKTKAIEHLPHGKVESRRGRGALLDVRECATYLGTTERHIRRLVSERRVPFIKLGSGHHARLRFDTARLDAWLAEHSHEPETAA